MPVVLVHGVNTRDHALPARFAIFLNRYVAPVMHVAKITPHFTFWGDLGARFRFGGRSRPRTRFFRQGGMLVPSTVQVQTEPARLAEVLHATPDDPEQRQDVTPTGYLRPGSHAPAAPAVRLRDLSDRALRDYLMAIVEEELPDDANTRPLLMMAIDDLLRDGSLQAALWEADADAEVDVLLEQIGLTMDAPSYLAHGGGLTDFGDRVREGLSRAAAAPGYAVSLALAELRPRTDSFVEQFVGDVLVYLDERTASSRVPGDEQTYAVLDSIDHRLGPAFTAIGAGPIQRRLLRDLTVAHAARAPGEPLVLITHSMGGQLAYDALTCFLPRLRDHLATLGFDEAELRRVLPFVNFWAATASQVGLFEELGLFLASDRDRYGGDQPVPFPDDFLGSWWNVWDHNDVLSYSVAGIIDRVDDEPIDSGRSMLGAHGAYLERPSFYRRLADKIDAQRQGLR